MDTNKGESPSEPKWINGVAPDPDVLSYNGTQVLELECRQQPDLLKKLLTTYSTDMEIREQLDEFARLSARRGPVLFLGMGGSYCSSLSASTFLTSRGRLSFSLDAGEWLHYGQPVWRDAALSILMTTSGESAELTEILKQSSHLPTGLISNNSASTGWGLSANRLPILAGPEYGNATKTYSNATAAAIILAAKIVNHDWQEHGMQAAAAFSSALDRTFASRHELEEFCRGAANIEIIGRGSAYGAAIMGALTIREMSGFRAAAHTGAGFKHGPNLDVDSSHVAIIFALGRVAQLGVRLAAECRRRGGKVVLVSSEAFDPSDRLLPIRIEAVAEPWESLTSIVVPQALTLAMIERNGCKLPPRFHYGPMEQ